MSFEFERLVVELAIKSGQFAHAIGLNCLIGQDLHLIFHLTFIYLTITKDKKIKKMR